MIDINDFIIHETLRKTPRYKGEVNKEKRFACYCEKCGIKRGYIKKSHYNKKSKLCHSCYLKSNEHRNKVRKGMLKYNKLNPPKKCPIKAFNNRLTTNLRNRLNSAIKGNYKTGSAVSDLGCSIEDFKKYIEAQFNPNFENKGIPTAMNWDNWSREGWHMDHIIPLDKFDLSDPKQFKMAVHYTNIQPLWAKVNIRKSNKLLSDIIINEYIYKRSLLSQF